MSIKTNKTQGANSKRAMLGHIYLIDDNADIRKHLSALLVRYGLTVDTYEDAESFLSESVEVSPAAILLDMVLPGINGLATHDKLMQSGRKTPVIYISGQSDPREIVAALKNGANDFLWKPFSTEELIDAIHKALAVDEMRLEKRISAEHLDRCWAQLTDREREICQLMLEGHGNSSIAVILGIKPDTAKKHRTKVFEKMGVDSLAKLLEMFRKA